MKRHAVPMDAEIALLQQRIYLHRIGLRLSADATREALRERLSSPGMLLAAAGSGFVLGLLTNKRATPDGQSATRRLWPMLTSTAVTALKFAQSGPVMWLASRLARRERQPASDEQPVPSD
jgi:hypothetical protein